ncbi:PcfJ domain-containing protein [Candidatus Neomarinimicrobiota bacterium]
MAKNTKSNKKIQNWHRPLGQDELKRWYLRNKLNPDWYREYFTPDTPEIFDPAEFAWERAAWNQEAEIENINSQYLDQLLTPILNHKQNHQLSKLLDVVKYDDSDIETNGSKSVNIMIEERLAYYIKKLYNIHEIKTLKSRIANNISSFSDIEKIKEVAPRSHRDSFTKLVILFSPFWVRDLKVWQGGGARALLNHLFVIYNVPKFLYEEWFVDLNKWYDNLLYSSYRNKWFIWFILIAQGGSLKRAAKYFNWIIPNGFQHHFQLLHGNMTSLEGCIEAEIIRSGGSTRELNLFLQNPSYATDPTENKIDYEARESFNKIPIIERIEPIPKHPDDTFWYDTLNWIIKNGNHISDDECNDILDWAMHMHTEDLRLLRDDPGYSDFFSWKNRTVKSTIDRSRHYIESLNIPYEKVRWKSLGLSWNINDGPHKNWSFVELTSGKELFREGNILHHCVSAYTKRCILGQAAIISMRYKNKIIVTIEINPKTYNIIQTRGFYNSDPSKNEGKIITLWYNTIVIPLKKH